MKSSKEVDKVFENMLELFDPKQVKQEVLSEDEMDDSSYYVVIIDEENGEKVVKAIKIENTDDFEKDSKVKREKDEAVDESEEEVDDASNLEEFSEIIEEDEAEKSQHHSQESNSGQSEEEMVACDTIIREDGVDGDMEESRINLMQVLAANHAEGNIMPYEEGVSLVGEVITGDLNIREGSTEQEVIVGDLDGEYHIITSDGEIAVLGDDEETITVMQQEDGSFLCECGEAYMDFADYENHIKIHNIYKCGVCDRGFESNEILEGHVMLHRSSDSMLQCPYCDQLVKRGIMTTHIKLHHNHVRHFCKTCKKSFVSDANLKRHMQMHNNYNRKYECNICYKRFAQKVAMETHRLNHEDAFLKCTLCPQKFNTEEECIQHQKEGCVFPPSEEKLNEKPNVCEICGKGYSTPASLKNHTEMAHGQGSEILCSECGEVLPTRKAMHSHSWAHKQGKTKNHKRFSCETCGKGCASHAMLLMHERVHTNERPFQCAKCPLAFKTKTHLTTHQLTHTQEKRFGCSVCMKFFALKGNLVVHLRTHTGERPYVCSICNQGFIDSKYLKKHKQKRHDIANIPWNQYY